MIFQRWLRKWERAEISGRGWALQTQGDVSAKVLGQEIAWYVWGVLLHERWGWKGRLVPDRVELWGHFGFYSESNVKPLKDFLNGFIDV